MNPRTISVVHDGTLPYSDQTKVFLDDGSILRGVRSVTFKAEIGNLPSLTLETFATMQEIKALQENTKLIIEIIDAPPN